MAIVSDAEWCSKRSKEVSDKIISSTWGTHFTPEDAQRIKDAVDRATIIQKTNQRT